MADVQVNPLPEGDGYAPRAEILVTNLSGVARITVRRTADGRTFDVRGMINLPVSGAVSRIDFSVPFNRPVTYRAELFDGAGASMGFTDPFVMPAIVSAGTWVHNPLRPEGAVRVSAQASTAQNLSRPTPGEVVYPIGRTVGVMVTGPRRGLSGMVFDVACDTEDEATRLQAMLGGYGDGAYTTPVLCIRPGADFRLRIPSTLYLGVLDMVEQDVNFSFGGNRVNQKMVGDEVSPPFPGLFIPLLTYADLKAYYSTMAALKADNATYLAVSRRYDLAGSANA